MFNWNPYQQAAYNPIPQQQYNTVPQQRQNIIFNFVNGIEDAKAYIIGPNQTAYLKDNNGNYMYEKRSDSNGVYTLEVYTLNKINKEDDYVKKSDFNALKEEIEKIRGIIKHDEQSTNYTTTNGQ